MVRYCSVPKCKSKCTDKGISFHYFPKDIFFRTEWVVKLKITRDPSKYSQVCSLHFEENDFINGVNNENLKRRRLRDNVIPSKFLPIDHLKSSEEGHLQDQNADPSHLPRDCPISLVQQNTSLSLEKTPPSYCLNSCDPDLLYPDKGSSLSSAFGSQEGKREGSEKKQPNQKCNGKPLLHFISKLPTSDVGSQEELRPIGKVSSPTTCSEDKLKDSKGDSLEINLKVASPEDDQAPLTHRTLTARAAGCQELSRKRPNSSNANANKINGILAVTPKISTKEVLLQRPNGQLIPYRISQPAQNTSFLKEQIKSLDQENEALKGQVKNLERECERLKEEANKMRYRIDSLDESKLFFYTGYGKVDFLKLFGMLSLSPQLLTLDRPKLALKDEFLLVLMKLKHGFRLEDLAYRIGLTYSTVSYIFHKWINIISIESSHLINFPSSDMEVPSENIRPSHSCIVGFIEMTYTCSSFCKISRVMTDSEHTFKVLVALFPNGILGFISPTYSVQTPEKEILLSSGFLNLLRPNFEILVDKDLGTQQLLMSSGSKLTIVLSRCSASKIASRIKREFHLIKEKFKILKSTFPQKYIEKNGKYSILDKLLRVCVALHNHDILSCNLSKDLRPTVENNSLEEYFENSEIDVINFLEDAYDMSQIGENLLSSEAIEKILQSFETSILADKNEDTLGKNFSFNADALDW